MHRHKILKVLLKFWKPFQKDLKPLRVAARQRNDTDTLSDELALCPEKAKHILSFP
jgi:hypothetical protein